MPMLRSSSSPSPTARWARHRHKAIWPRIGHSFSLHEILKYAHLKFTVYGRKQASKQAYTRTMQSHKCGACSGLPLPVDVLISSYTSDRTWERRPLYA